MFFASDNAGPVHASVIRALEAANTGYVPGYGNDALTHDVQARIRALFDAPDAVVHFVATGTAANSLALATLVQPWQTVFCTAMAHIQEDECNAPVAFMGGATLRLVDDVQAKLDPAALRAAIAAQGTRGIHGAQPGAVQITQLTEKGTLYTLDEIKAVTDVAHVAGLPVHMDGARFTNALVALGCSPAEMTWKAGIDVVSFGGTKNGLMGVEAVVIFDPARGQEFEYRRKRGAHLFSKHRYLAAQFGAFLDDDLWLDMARSANATTAHLAAGFAAAGHAPAYPVEGNIIFIALPRALHRKLMAAGAVYSLTHGPLGDGPDDELLEARFVCDWSLPIAQVDAFLAHL
ncbi:putative low-specificity L-threonine aldolase 1 [Ketogulonicigenium robustum]|uniref:Putative low-specificity L-threonine aldolase 1 n=1 Tax=Ketogulonicigenium robustum TaxID=92947 RepID=A0A1W6NY35_9RHOB|nr:beta-eliminating lyase-related protein [Ketogulonicigenium robustum]ARO14073.1 putative low-specificity L-threonine aldolase 1 [Ketogulonicigenium robustum]